MIKLDIVNEVVSRTGITKTKAEMAVETVFDAMKHALETGDRIWMTQQATGERALHSTAHMIRQGDRVFINNDMGELIIAKLTPEGYNEISRAKLIAPTTPATQRRTGGKVNWTKPAYANRHIIIRNDEEIISVNLAAQ